MTVLPIEFGQPSYRMPAEWEPQSAVWVTWPDNLETWPENRLHAQIEFTAFVKSIAEVTSVFVMVNQPSLTIAKRNLIQADTFNIHLIDIPTNDAWARDYAPTFVLNSDHALVAIDWEYNAWGGKYPPYELDQQVAQKIATGQNIPSIQPGLCFEGGAIETNGRGVLLSTRSCANDPRRNPAILAEQRIPAFEHAFETYLGAVETIWLGEAAIAGDDTDGHIDQLARFTSEQAIVYAWCTDSADPQALGLKQNRDELQLEIDRLGLSVDLIPLPIPAAIEHYGRRIPASYCNFLITNDLVVVPQFGVPEDANAVARLKELFNDKYVLGLPSRNLSVGLGSFHCLSQQVPFVQTE